MPHSFVVLTDSPATIDQIHAAFRREDYWLARVAGGDSTELDSLVVDADGRVRVRITQHLGRQILPGVVARVVSADLKLLYTETWHLAGDGRVRGESIVSASGGLGSSRAENWLTAVSGAAQLRSEVKVEVKIPLVGGQLEKSIGAALAKSIPETLRFTTTWIAEQA